MALRLKDNRSRNLKLTSGAVVIGTAFLLFKTYPHIKNSIFGFLGCEKELPREDNEPIELKEDEEDKEEEEFDNLAESSLVDVGSWTDDNLKSWLTQVCNNFLIIS